MKSLRLAQWIGIVLLLIGVIVQIALCQSLLQHQTLDIGVSFWLALHFLATLLISAGTVLCCFGLVSAPLTGVGLLSVFAGLTMPVVGGLGFALAFLFGTSAANRRNAEEVYWQVTNNIGLPFTTPIGRQVSKYDSRGFIEQLMYSHDNSDLYRKVLAASNIKASLSVGLLKKAVQHPDDKIRLTAYQTLDRKVTGLNREIQRLESKANNQEGLDKSNTWLHIASNYWELLTLEKEEPVARKQLLSKARAAAQRAIDIQSDNRNAHFTLGRTALMQSDAKQATESFTCAMDLGMPQEKIMPYLAEAAFCQRDLQKVANNLAAIDDAFKLYPPLSHVARYWQSSAQG